jgi:hypothetical protein
MAGWSIQQYYKKFPIIIGHFFSKTPMNIHKQHPRMLRPNATRPEGQKTAKIPPERIMEQHISLCVTKCGNGIPYSGQIKNPKDKRINQPIDQLNTRREYRRLGLPKMVNTTPIQGIDNQIVTQIHGIEIGVIFFFSSSGDSAIIYFFE